MVIPVAAVAAGPANGDPGGGEVDGVSMALRVAERLQEQELVAKPKRPVRTRRRVRSDSSREPRFGCPPGRTRSRDSLVTR